MMATSRFTRIEMSAAETPKYRTSWCGKASSSKANARLPSLDDQPEAGGAREGQRPPPYENSGLPRGPLTSGCRATNR